jgi:hypothetical protein
MTRRLAGALLIVLMAIGSVLLWIGIPVGWLFLASQVADSSQPTIGPYVGKLLAALDRAYGRATGMAPQTRVQAPWHRSLRGERRPSRRAPVLDVVMVCSVALAVVCFAVRFCLFAGSSLPTT